MKVAALVSGLLASALAWGASYFVTDLREPFLALWPITNSQQFLALVAWYAILAAGLVGGLLTVFAPALGALILLGTAAAWAAVGLHLPTGFSPQVVVPLAFAAVGGLAAIGAMVRRRVRRTRQEPSAEDADREEALRLEPDDELARAVDRRQARKEPPITAAASAENEAIRVAVRPPTPAAPPRIPAMFVLNLALLLVLLGAVAVLFYTSIRSGDFAAAFSGTPTTAVVIEPDGAAAPDVAAIAAATPPAEEAGVGATPAQIRISSAPLDVSALPPDKWTDPFEYCMAVGTIDFPDHRYAGPMLAEPIAAALRVPASTSPDRAHWRCVDGEVLGCASFRGVSCALTPTLAEMRAYCEQNPDAKDLAAPNGSWSCEEGRPALPPGASWPVDARGFLPGAWVAITAPAGLSPST